MIFLSIYCDNIYMFRDFFIDFAIKRKYKHSLAQNEMLFEGSKINVRKKLIILGGNASGKTTLGRLLCAVQYYLIGREMDRYINLKDKIYDKKKPGTFKVEFAIKEEAYSLECVFNENGIIKESLKNVRIYPSYSINALRKKLEESAPVDTYMDDDASNYESLSGRFGMASNLLSKPSNKKLLNIFRGDMQFTYSFSNFASRQFTRILQVPVEKLNEILPNIDNSVDRVVALKSSESDIESHSYMIVFKNGEHLTIPDGDLSRADRSRLSHGTYEALQFLGRLIDIKNNPSVVAYLDEQLAHQHTELESYMVMRALLLPREGQLFCTTHNNELLDLNVSPQMILLFRRNKDGFNEAFYVSDKISKNDRGFKGYNDNDFFGVQPDYSVLDVFFEEE